MTGMSVKMVDERNEGNLVAITLQFKRLENHMDIQLADVVVHIDQTLGVEERAGIEDGLRAIDGVVSVHNPDKRPHLAVVEYNPNKTNSQAILSTVMAQGVHAELVGL